MGILIDQNTLDIRMTLLEMEIDELKHRLPEMDNDEAFAALNDGLKERTGQLKECTLWLKILNQDPGWGDIVNVKGKRMPKMPTFKSEEEMDARFENWEGGGSAGDGLTMEQAMRAREGQARKISEESVQFMDGEGPIAVEEEPEHLSQDRERDILWNEKQGFFDAEPE
jgi:FtsZ-binding cell division protein ZapB